MNFLVANGDGVYGRSGEPSGSEMATSTTPPELTTAARYSGALENMGSIREKTPLRRFSKWNNLAE
jgi:hypothetical protein